MSEPRNHFVYHLFNRDCELLYVGCSRRVERRLQEHKFAKPAMFAEIHHIKLKGPYTRTVARAIERADIRGPIEPLYGWTPQRNREQRQRSRWIEDRWREFVADGVDIEEALRRSVADADEWFPDPNEYDFAVDRPHQESGGRQSA